MEKYETTDLIPANGVFISNIGIKNFSGFLVASYDAEGFASDPRWFSTYEEAVTYADALASKQGE